MTPSALTEATVTKEIDELVSELRGLVEKAAPGPWKDGNEAMFVVRDETAHGRPWCGTVFVDGNRECLVALTWAPEAEQTANLARYIAAANPANITKLLDCVTSLSARIRGLEAGLKQIDTMPYYKHGNWDPHAPGNLEGLLNRYHTALDVAAALLGTKS